ncbi:bifunctional hydroxymethylpyrimidine kinase/phosphomethylpyrimidine kinase [Halobaculum sp. MBLA0143]|uniref:bifunctional hydroxymethylpyrimidine kinase/phosphomethylpyrimidine kinase n=1 Tax=Halobaculum sp. MBLA0143 TaxID=3079933 RepID=UPI0035255891
MRETAPDDRPVVLTVAGSDSGGGAGVQADVVTATACGAFATSVVTSVTAQNTRGVASTHVLPVAEVRAQLDAVFDDFDVAAVKTGMLATAEMVELVTEYARERDVPFVVDPVMVAASGDRLLDPAAESAYETLLAESAVVTPNAGEATVLTGVKPESADDLRQVGEELVASGADAALVKGGHVETDPVRDVLVRRGDDDTETDTFTHPRVDTDATHGSGCTLSSAIAAELAGGATTTAAVDAATDRLARAVRYPLAVGDGPGAVNHAVELRDEAAREATRETLTAVRESSAFQAVGDRVAAATPYAETVDDVATVTESGVAFGREESLSETLLAVREGTPATRVAVGVTPDVDTGQLRVADGVATVGAETEVVAVSDGAGPVVLAPDGETARERLERLGD